MTMYECSRCGITSETHHHWGPICRQTGKRVCDICCYQCRYRVGLAGIKHCSYETDEQKRAQVMKRIADRFLEEDIKATEAFLRHKKEKARLQAIKDARARGRHK